MIGLGLGGAPAGEGGGGGGGSFEGLTADWDVANITPQSDDTALTTWPESEQGLDALNIHSNPPRYRTSLGPSGGPCVYFNGTSYRLGRGSVAVSSLLTVESDPAVAQSTLYVVTHRIGAQTIFPCLIHHVGTDDLTLTNTGGNLNFRAGNSTTGEGQIVVANPTGWIDNWRVLAIARRGLEGRLYMDAVQQATPSFSVVGIAGGTNTLMIGSAGNFSNNSWAGYVARIMVCNVGHSDAALVANSEALLDEYGLAA